jgi:Fic family protein
VQNWIGGSDHSPRGAMYVPPPADTVAPYLADLVAFANRDDMSALAQAAVAHAQFESIHPFTDGNGRIGRALVNAVLRRRGATSHVVVPLASSLVAHRDRYFDALTAYRSGDPRPIISSFARAATIAAAESRVTAGRLAGAPREMLDLIGGARSGSATAKILDLLASAPVLSASELSDATGASDTSLYDALERLRAAGVIRPLTNRKRNQVWGAALILDELEDLSVRIEAASR